MKMTTRKQVLTLLLAGGVATIAVIASMYFSYTPENSPISRKGYKQLREGMMEHEVNQLLGVLPGNYATGEVAAINPPLGMVGKEPSSDAVFRREHWSDDRTGVRVVYNSDGRLVSAFAWSQCRRGILPLIGRALRSAEP